MAAEKNFCWTDNMYLDGDKAWLVTGRGNVLTRLDLRTNACDFSKLLPNSRINKIRFNTRCFRYNELVYCAPCYDDGFWIYDSKKDEFSRMEIENPGKVLPKVSNYFFEKEGKLFVASLGLGTLLEIDMYGRKITNSYTLASDGWQLRNGCLRIDNELFYISVSSSSRIHVFDMVSGDIRTYEPPIANDCVNTICYDGKKFWLSGCRRKIYIWDIKDNSVQALDCLPEGLGIYNFLGKNRRLLEYGFEDNQDPVFIDAVNTEKYIWYIPFRTNEIVYIDKESCKARIFELPDEIETEDSIRDRELSHKYLYQYFRENRYIGLFSFKQSALLEIDTENLSWRKREFAIPKKAIKELEFKAAFEEQLFCEQPGYLELFIKTVGKE